MIKLIAAMAVGCLLTLTGCTSMSVYREKVTAYRPDLGGRYLGSQSGIAVRPDRNTNASPDDQQRTLLETERNNTSKSTLLKRGDKIIINIFAPGQPTQLEDVVDDDGTVNLPFIGLTKIGGLSTPDAERHIEKTYIDERIYKQIQVSVVKQFEGEYFVQGEINNKQGVFLLSGDTTLLEAIAKAGGPTVFANLKKVKLIRGGQATIYNVKKMQDGDLKPPLIKPGDIIYVPKGWV